MVENDATRDDYEDKYLGGGEDDLTERLADIDDETAEARAQALLEGLDDYDLDEEDRALLGAWGFDFDEEDEQFADPVVAIVGRPNVGKSTIINRILGRREAVVEDKPGVTRDRVSYKAEWVGKRFTLVDTGGWESDARGIDAQVADQAEIAVEQADVVILVVDARVGITASDEQIVRMLRRVKKPIILMANKIDDSHLEPEIYSLWSLGMGQPFPVSGLHGRGLADALDELLEVMPEHSQYAQPEAPGGPRRVALIGRPNVGKSSLLNKLAGSERAVVNDLAGTTRDPIDEVIELGGYPWRFIDTAGIRRRQHMAKGAEFYSSLRTQTALERSEVAVVLLDVSEPLSEQDVRIIQTTIDSGRAMVLAFTFATPAQAQFGNILKKAKDAVKEKAKEKVEEAKEKVVNKAANAIDNIAEKDKDKAADKAADKTAGNTEESVDTYFFINGSNLSKSGQYNKLISLYKQNFEPSKEALAHESFANN